MKKNTKIWTKFGLKNRKIKVRKILVPQKISATKISWNKVYTIITYPYSDIIGIIQRACELYNSQI